MGVYSAFDYDKFIQESLNEKLFVCRYCLEYEKSFEEWGSFGCLGHPALTLLGSIIDSLGSYIFGGNTRNHFNILSDKKYFPEIFTKQEIDKLWKLFRSPQTHNSTLPPETKLEPGDSSGKFLIIGNKEETIYLKTMYKSVDYAVQEFYKDAKNIVYSSSQIKNILKLRD